MAELRQVSSAHETDGATALKTVEPTARPTIEEIREMVPAVLQTAYLNTGTCGPMPRVTWEAMRVEHEKELTPNRIDADHFPAIGRAKQGVREAVARMINARPEDIAITHRTTEGMYIAIMGYPWQQGQEIILSNIEHPGGLNPSFLAKRRFGVRTRVADIGLGGGDPADVVMKFEELINPRTRMIVISHISYTTGATLPVKEIAEMARSYDVLVTVDAAQSFGAIQLDMQDLGVDFYACPGQKWACGPEGTGALYVRPESLGAIEQTFAGGNVPGSMDYHGGTVAPALGAARFDTAGQSVTQTVGQQTSIDWITSTIGMDLVAERMTNLAEYTYDALSNAPGISVVTPKEAVSGLIAFNVDGIEPTDLKLRLAEEHNVTIRDVSRYINNPDAVRASMGFYNDESDIDRLVSGIEAVRASL